MERSNRLSVILFSLASLALIVLALVSTGDFQGGDTYLHFLTARFAPQHPELFLDHWGKPVFTTLYFLPSQVSYEFARLFTVFIAILSAYQLMQWAKELGIKHAYTSALFLLFSPIYIWMAVSTMTEVLFGLWLVIGLRLLTRKQWVWATILLSFLPFIRTEGFVLLPFIACWILWCGEKRSVLLLAVGTVFYSVVGGIYYDDFLWLINKNPYPVKVGMYGSGSWFHFFSSIKTTWGISFFLFVLLGAGVIIASRKKLNTAAWILIVFSALAYVVFHSIAWATGTMASLGELRVLAAVMPLFALLAAVGADKALSRLNGPLNAFGRVVIFLLLAFNAVAIINPPIKAKKEIAVMNDVALFVSNNYSGRKIWCTNVQIAKDLDIDIWNRSKFQMYLTDSSEFARVMNKGDVIIWDAHFSPNEGHTPLKTLLDYNGLKEIKRFYPQKNFTVLGGLNYEVVLFVVE